MTDILIRKQRDRANIIPKSSKGLSWMRRNFVNGLRDLTISSEHVNEFTEALEEQGLEVEVK